MAHRAARVAAPLQPPVESDIHCEACEDSEAMPDQALHFCYACDFTFCQRCWDAQLPHRKKAPSTSAVVHEKTNPWTARKVQGALSPPVDEASYSKLCAQDEHTSWFGVNRHVAPNEPLVFQDTGRYVEIMASTKGESRASRLSFDSVNSDARETRSPSLVSFVGQSGAGKSTLINLLVTFKSSGMSNETFPAPVVGMTGKDVPTSEDVHLYADPETVASDAPLLFADCEGLEGGEREPVGSRYRKSRIEGGRMQDRITYPTPRAQYSSERQIVWADTPAKRTRQFAVTNLYPRLLYTFSDTIVFVLKNPRVIESVFERLIEWAAAALETSSNQPMLPCAIITLNASETNIAPELWDVESGTNNLLESLAQTVHSNACFQKFAQFWNDRSTKITTLKDLVLCYYSSIQIVRIPAAGRPKLMKEQCEKLYTGIVQGCAAARKLKQSLRLLLNATELQSYLQYAFDHFAHTLDEPFDFVQASFVSNPIPMDFGGSILRLAISMMEHQIGQADAFSIFQQLGSMVASCIMLDSVRHQIRGDAERIYPEYISHIDFALQEFCDHHWPCEFTAFGIEYPYWLQHFDAITAHRNVKYLTRQSKCINVRSGHGSKGHQAHSGAIFSTGFYVSKFSFEGYSTQFQEAVYFRLQHLMTALAEGVASGHSAEVAAHRIHQQETLLPFYKNMNGNNRFFYSHSICLSCLLERPEHALPCGHILCASCIKAYGNVMAPNLVQVHECPLEISESSRRFPPFSIFLKPEAAGARVLVLDGGGIRCAVQLEVLRLLEAELKGRLPLQYFFDLIVGTNTGGLIALGLTTNGWSAEKCSYYIEKICREAYARRAGRGIPGIGHLLETYSKSKFDTDALERSLQNTFSEKQLLFGGFQASDAPTSTTKVAVTATSPNGDPVVFSNYNRRCEERLPYVFCRPSRLYQEVRVWEAARSTMATPKLFKSFRHEASKKIYTASDTKFNNPVALADKERRILWAEEDLLGSRDLVISIGAGSEAQPNPNPSGSVRSVAPSMVDTIRKFGIQRDPLKHLSPARLSQMASDNFATNIAAQPNPPRYIRIDGISMISLPPGEDISEMDDLQRLVRAHMDPDIVKITAAKLLAAMFYFDTDKDIIEQVNGTFMAQGYLLCRIPNNTNELSNLGKLIRERDISSPRFIINEAEQQPIVIDMSPKILEDMILNLKFGIGPLQVVLSKRLAVVQAMLHLDSEGGHSISGFPRSLLKRENKAAKVRKVLASAPSMHGSDTMSVLSRTSKNWQPPTLDRKPSFASSSISWAKPQTDSIETLAASATPTTTGQHRPPSRVSNSSGSVRSSSPAPQSFNFPRPPASPSPKAEHLEPFPFKGTSPGSSASGGGVIHGNWSPLPQSLTLARPPPVSPIPTAVFLSDPFKGTSATATVSSQGTVGRAYSTSSSVAESPAVSAVPTSPLNGNGFAQHAAAAHGPYELDSTPRIDEFGGPNGMGRRSPGFAVRRKPTRSDDGKDGGAAKPGQRKSGADEARFAAERRRIRDEELRPLEERIKALEARLMDLEPDSAL